jgi:hypothetical protein
MGMALFAVGLVGGLGSRGVCGWMGLTGGCGAVRVVEGLVNEDVGAMRDFLTRMPFSNSLACQ